MKPVSTTPFTKLGWDKRLMMKDLLVCTPLFNICSSRKWGIGPTLDQQRVYLPTYSPDTKIPFQTYCNQWIYLSIYLLTGRGIL